MAVTHCCVPMSDRTLSQSQRNLKTLATHGCPTTTESTEVFLYSPRDKQLFREVRNQHTQAVRKSKGSFFKQKFASCRTNSKKFWDTVKSMENKSTSSQLPTALRLENPVTSDKSTIIEIFN